MSERRRRVKCCGSDLSAIQSEKYNGTSTTCFRCGETRWVPKEPELRVHQEPARDRPPPPDYGDPWPSEATAWLALLGFGRYEREQVLKAYWSERVRRIIFPMKAGYWTGRALDPGRPKWLSALYGRDRCVAEFTPDGLKHPDWPVVLTEDLLSAAKVGLSAEVTAIPCLGTLPSPAVLARAAEAPATIWWMDPDAAGQRMQRRQQERLAAVGIHTHLMPTFVGDTDPKYLQPAAIRERLAAIIGVVP